MKRLHSKTGNNIWLQSDTLLPCDVSQISALVIESELGRETLGFAALSLSSEVWRQEAVSEFRRLPPAASLPPDY